MKLPRAPGCKGLGTANHTSGCTKLLSDVLSVIAGSTDATSFLGLGLFSAHVTGNLVSFAAHLVARRADNACLALSVPLFILVLALTRLLVAGLGFCRTQIAFT